MKSLSMPRDRGAVRPSRIDEMIKSQARILLAHDRINVRTSIETTLAAVGYQITSCADGIEALSRVKSGSYDLLITTIVLPRMDGLELLTSLRRFGLQTKSIALSDAQWIDGAYLRCASLLGASAVFRYPFDTAEFLDTVKELVPSGISTSY